MSMAAATVPPLQVLAPKVRRLVDCFDTWRGRARRSSAFRDAEPTLRQQANDLARLAHDLETDKPLLVVLLMGGTGVGKSSLLNALARGAVAHASFTRPTTRDSVVYFHASVDPNRLDARLRQCKLVSHERPSLAQKIIIDTPDLDSNEPSHREKLRQVLPLADVVLYVGSQEKYHDQAGWEMFLEQRQRRAFAFVLNKWDRCLHGLASGLRPDEDLLKDLRDEGFAAPLIFRTCAQAWIEAQGKPNDLPPGEQFAELEHWLEQGLTHLEIQAIKTRGVGQLLTQMDQVLREVRPPDLTEALARTEQAWKQTLEEEADAVTDRVLATLEPYQRDLERHFAVHALRLFRGVTAACFRFFHWVRHLGGALRQWWPRWSATAAAAHAAAPAAGDLAGLADACSQLAADRHLDARERALPNRLLVQADEAGMPVGPLNQLMVDHPAPAWRSLLPGFLQDSFADLETAWNQPEGGRHLLQRSLAWIGDLLPIVIVGLTSAWLLYDYFLATPRRTFALYDLFLPLVAVFFALLLFYLILNLLLPSRWPVIRGAFRRRLRDRLSQALTGHYGPLPQRLARELAEERAAVDALLAEVNQVRSWIETQEQSAQVTALYGRG